MDYVISTENTCDLDERFLSEKGISVIKMSYMVDGNEYGADTGKELDIQEFYNKMRNGSSTATSLVNEARATEYFAELLKRGKDILHVSFASACSGTCENMQKAAEELNKISENKIIVVDSRAESAGQGLLVDLVYEYAQKGYTIEQTAKYANEVRDRINLLFTVENLKYLAAGGRISKTSATVGNLLSIKPVLSVDEEGKLTARTKVITRRISINRLVGKTMEKFTGESDKIYIGHSDCESEALSVKEKLSNISSNIKIVNIGPVIGAHSGPGTIAIFFLGEDRKF